MVLTSAPSSGSGANLVNADSNNVTNLIVDHFEPGFTEAVRRDNTMLQIFPTVNAKAMSVQWKVHYAGNTSAGSYSELDTAPAAVAQTTFDAEVTIRQNWITYGVSGKAMAATNGPAGFVDALSFETQNAAEDLKNELNNQMLATTLSPNTDMDGIGVILDGTATTYGGASFATYPNFKAYVTDNSGVDRPLTISLMQDQLINLRQPSRKAKITNILTAFQHYADYGNLMQDLRRFVNTMKLDGGLGDALVYENIPVIQVPDMATGDMYFVDKSVWGYYVRKNFDTKELAQLGDVRTFLITHYANLICRHPGKNGRITDLG